MLLSDYLTVDRVSPEMQSTNKPEAVAELAAVMAGHDPALSEQIAQILHAREQLASTAIGKEIAIPHGKLGALGAMMLGIGRCADGLDFESVDDQPTRIFFTLLAPEDCTILHLQALARISRMCREGSFFRCLLEAADAKEMYQIFCEFDSRQATS